MKRALGGRIGRPLTLVGALLSLTLALGTLVAANAAVRTPSHTVAKSAAGTMKSYVTGTASHGRTVVGSFTPSKFVQKNGKLAAIGKLDVVAVSGAGNLLGNLLCAVAGLLDGVGVLGQVSDLLNQILAVLKA
jgi:hypothetical protein